MDWAQKHFELSRGGADQGVLPMEGLRGFAVFLVFLVHYITLVKPWLGGHSSLVSVATGLHKIGNTGVDLFFVLSGYLIYGSLISRPPDFKRFMLRRLVRIYPAFIAVFIIYVALSFALPSESKIPKTVFQASTYLVQNFLLLPGLVPIKPMISVAWSLSYEMFYYLVTPLIIVVLGLRRRSYRWRGRFFSGVAVAFFCFCAIFGGPVRLSMFIAGILLYETLQSGRLSPPRNSTALLALVIGFLGVLLPLTGSSGSATKIAFLFVSFFIVCFCCLSSPRTWLPRCFSWSPLRWLGNMSYSYYLLHGLALRAVFLAFAAFADLNKSSGYGSIFFCTFMPVAFCLTLIPTSALFLLVERPVSLTPRGKHKPKPNREIIGNEATAGAP